MDRRESNLARRIAAEQAKVEAPPDSAGLVNDFLATLGGWQYDDEDLPDLPAITSDDDDLVDPMVVFEDAETPQDPDDYERLS